MGFGYHKRGSILLSVSIRTGKYAGGTKMSFSFVRIWLVSTNKSITRGHTKLVLGNRCLKALWCLCLVLYHLYVRRKVL
eukprot:Em0050g23a